MSLESDLTVLVEQVLPPERVFWDTTPDGFIPKEPTLIMQWVGGREVWYVDNTIHEWQNARVQFYVWGARRSAVNDAIRALRNKFAEISGNGVFVIWPEGGPVGEYNEILKLRGQRQDFGVWHKAP